MVTERMMNPEFRTPNPDIVGWHSWLPLDIKSLQCPWEIVTVSEREREHRKKKNWKKRKRMENESKDKEKERVINTDL